ncbi:unnamed protein product [Pleuronectes platessa]|uniref:Uncharacterized protein n=1 Tax=Pleuronectes platessa TaxID=8262 RepID=A0A9N7UM12_PLEPL|nr:unnamed protein product [Pleuronectes platessa]
MSQHDAHFRLMVAGLWEERPANTAATTASHQSLISLSRPHATHLCSSHINHQEPTGLVTPFGIRVCAVTVVRSTLACSTQPALPSLLYPAGSTQPILARLLYPTCSTQPALHWPALPSLLYTGRLYPACSTQPVLPSLLYPACSTLAGSIQPALPSLFYPACSTQPVLPSLLYQAGFTQPALPSLFYPACSTQPALPSLLYTGRLYPACSTQPAIPSRLYPAYSSPPALPHLLYHACSTQPALPSLLYQAGFTQPILARLLYPTCSSTPALPSLLYPACSTQPLTVNHRLSSSPRRSGRFVPSCRPIATGILTCSQSISVSGSSLLPAHQDTANLRKFMDLIQHNQEDKVSKMLERGFDPNYHDGDTGESPLTFAAHLDGVVELIKVLKNGGAHLDFRAKDGMTSLHKAARSKNQVTLMTLLELGASPDYKDSRGLTPLYHSVVVGGDPGCCELLLSHQAAVCCQDENGWHEVHQACRHGHVQHLEHLLFYGADMSAQNASGNTALHVCALYNQDNCARVLLVRGADKNSSSIPGKVKNPGGAKSFLAAMMTCNLRLSCKRAIFRRAFMKGSPTGSSAVLHSHSSGALHEGKNASGC